MIQIIKSIKEKLMQFQAQHCDPLERELEKLKILLEISQNLDASSSRSWIGYQANYYFQNFSKVPSSKYNFNIDWESYQIPNYWQEVSYEEIVEFIEGKNPDYTLEETQGIIKPILEEIQNIQRYMLTELIVIQTDNKYVNECEDLERLKNYRWGATYNALITAQKPKNYFTSNISAIQQGIWIPLHITYSTKVIVEISKIKSIQEYITEANTVIRKIEIRSEISPGGLKKDIYSNLFKIFNRFHLVSRQLRDRHGDRPTLQIEDEYDVQDLLHCLLKLYFDDIRPEEWTPSYCGGSSRMDFLIKTEQIVIEVKKTRMKLDENEIGNQLLIDIAKYSQHPDCKTLICFIYDPEGRIGNPTGLETDLNDRSNEELKIIAIINPKF